MGEAATFRVIGEVSRVDMDRASPRFVLLSADGRDPQEVCLARREGDRFLPVSGPFTLDQVQELAGNVLAGSPRARTEPEALNALALFVSAFCLLYRLGQADETSAATPPAPEPAPPALDCTPDARAVPPTQESLFTCTPCGG